jgi:hypothetical protein
MLLRFGGAMKSLRVAEGLMNKNRKQADGYVEIFHEEHEQGHHKRYT